MYIKLLNIWWFQIIVVYLPNIKKLIMENGNLKKLEIVQTVKQNGPLHEW